MSTTQFEVGQKVQFTDIALSNGIGILGEFVIEKITPVPVHRVDDACHTQCLTLEGRAGGEMSGIHFEPCPDE